MKTQLIRRAGPAAVMMASVVLGCDKTALDVAREAADRQAEQNLEMSRLNREVAGGTKRIVEAEADLQASAAAMQQQLQAERTQIADGREALEAERKAMNAERHRALAQETTAKGAVTAIAALLTLSIAWLALHAPRSNDSSLEDALELLVEDGFKDCFSSVALSRPGSTPRELPAPAQAHLPSPSESV